ncbi:hypothetical protein PHLCEN_2v10872 [Hermanssonia centrifuga]|uniref:Uncharacterized protein n=1 Tax=Hermanssonia centrifuga TaxID=98765 RepID=A0A2R6NLM5_9APHY|nr:hypothetical protein PHLCEN_2v10872 [Hermanssonia centrifuga]
MNVAAQLLNDTLDSPRYSDASYIDWKVWMKDAVLVLLSVLEHLMTQESCRTLVRCTSSPEDRQSVIHQLLLFSWDPQNMAYEGYRCVFERLHGASSPLMLFRLEETTSGAIDFIQSSVCNGGCVHGSGLGEIIDLSPKAETGMWGHSLYRLIDKLEHFQTLRIQLEQDNVSAIVAVAGQCLDLLGSQPGRSAIENFIKDVSRAAVYQRCFPSYGLEDLIRGLKAFIPDNKVSQYPILDTLP